MPIPTNSALASRRVMMMLSSRATVYGGASYAAVQNDPITGQPLANVACWLKTVRRQPASTGAARRELAALRELWFDPAVTIPEHGVRIEVAGHLAPNGATARWNPNAGTFQVDQAPDGTAIVKRVDCTRAT